MRILCKHVQLQMNFQHMLLTYAEYFLLVTLCGPLTPACLSIDRTALPGSYYFQHYN